MPKPPAITGKKTATSPRSGATIPTGAHPKNTGGKKGRSGRPPSEVKRACLLAFAQRVPMLAKIAADVEVSPGDRIRAIDVLGKYAGLQSVEIRRPLTVQDLQTMTNAELDAELARRAVEIDTEDA